MRKITLLLSLLMTLFTTAMAEDPSIMEITKGKSYTIRFIKTGGLVYYNTAVNNLYAKKCRQYGKHHLSFCFHKRRN